MSIISCPSISGDISGGQYKLIKQIGLGSFGIVYECIDISNNEHVAVKIELYKGSESLCSHENNIYDSIKGGSGIPRIRLFTQFRGKAFLVMDLLGKSLENLFLSCSKKFKMKTVLMLADQMISRVEYLHSKNIIHRDIKPANFLMGIGDHCNTVYVIDFGLAKKYSKSENKEEQEGTSSQGTGRQRISRKSGKFTGTPAFASLNVHLGNDPSRRDDLEALGYVLMYFNMGTLPWYRVKAANGRQMRERIQEKKMSTSVRILCKGFPVQFAEYLKYCRKLGFHADPDYEFLRNLFRSLFRELKYNYDFKFDWTITETAANTA